MASDVRIPPPPHYDALREIPSWYEWSELRSRFIEGVHESFSRWIGSDQAHYKDQLAFAAGRFDEGAALVNLFASRSSPTRQRILDIGSGNGGLALAFGNCSQYDVCTLDITPNPQLREFWRALHVPLRPTVADGARLPFAADSFDLVLLFDVFEHLREPSAVGREVMRVLRPGGACLVTTPARLRYLTKPDPHYGIRFLLLLPNDVQRFVVNHVFRRRIVGTNGTRHEAYDVEHTYWHVAEIAEHFPGRKVIDVLYSTSFDPPGRFTRKWWRHPRLAFEQLRYTMRFWLYEHVLIYKGQPRPGTPRYDPYPARGSVRVRT